MKYQSLEQSKALTAGAELWVTADIIESAWTRRLNWYLNFQISKYHAGSASELAKASSDAIKDLSSQFNFEFHPPKILTDKALLISPKHLLPCLWCVLLPYENDMDRWLHGILAVQKQLRPVSLRLFTSDTSMQSKLGLSLNKLNSSTFVTSSSVTFDQVDLVLPL